MSTHNKWNLAKSIAIPVIGGSVLGMIATKSAIEDYNKLKQPSFAPPGWIFPVAWTTLYTAMGIAKHLFDKQPKSKELQVRSNIAYSTQLGFNFLWPFLFFKWNLRGTALVEAMLLLSSTSLSAYYFHQKSNTAGNLMIPYVGWVTFAIALNHSVWKLNK